LPAWKRRLTRKSCSNWQRRFIEGLGNPVLKGVS
jgi:hypothetical protein